MNKRQKRTQACEEQSDDELSSGQRYSNNNIKSRTKRASNSKDIDIVSSEPRRTLALSSSNIAKSQKGAKRIIVNHATSQTHSLSRQRNHDNFEHQYSDSISSSNSDYRASPPITEDNLSDFSLSDIDSPIQKHKQHTKPSLSSQTSRKHNYSRLTHAKLDVLWHGTVRREYKKRSDGDNQIMIRTTKILQAAMVTGLLGVGFNPWWQSRAVHLSDTMRGVWEQQFVIYQKPLDIEDDDVSQKPSRHTARKIYDDIGDFRGKLMTRIRNLVASHYPFSESNRQIMITQLLLSDSFTCENFKKPLEKRFMAKIIIIAIAQCFYHLQTGLGTDKLTEHMFRPLRAETVILICYLIWHGISEYKVDGKKQTIKIDGIQAKTPYDRLKNTWDAQSEVRKVTILRKLEEKIDRQMGIMKNNMPDTTEAVANPYKDSIDDLLDSDDEMLILNENIGHSTSGNNIDFTSNIAIDKDNLSLLNANSQNKQALSLDNIQEIHDQETGNTALGSIAKASNSDIENDRKRENTTDCNLNGPTANNESSSQLVKNINNPPISPIINANSRMSTESVSPVTEKLASASSSIPGRKRKPTRIATRSTSLLYLYDKDENIYEPGLTIQSTFEDIQQAINMGVGDTWFYRGDWMQEQRPFSEADQTANLINELVNGQRKEQRLYIWQATEEDWAEP